MAIPTISLRQKATAHAPAWMIGATMLVVELVLVLAIMTAASHRHLTTIYARLAAQEPMLNVLNSASARIVALTGRSGAVVRLVYDSERKRGVLLVATLGNPGDEFSYRLWMVGKYGLRSAWAFDPGGDDLTIVPIKADFTLVRRVAVFVEHRNSERSVPILFGTL